MIISINELTPAGLQSLILNTLLDRFLTPDLKTNSSSLWVDWRALSMRIASQISKKLP